MVCFFLRFGFSLRLLSSACRWLPSHCANKSLVSLYVFTFLLIRTTAAAKSLQCPTLCDPIAGSPPGSTVPGILQARTLEWVAISFSNAWKWKVKVKSRSSVQLSGTPWTAAYQAPLSMGFSRQEYWSGVPLPSPYGLQTPDLSSLSPQLLSCWSSLVAQLVKNPPAMRETWVWSLGSEDPLEKGKATHSSILAWRIPWTLSSLGSQRIWEDWVTFTFTFILG